MPGKGGGMPTMPMPMGMNPAMMLLVEGISSWALEVMGFHVHDNFSFGRAKDEANGTWRYDAAWKE